MSVGSPVVTAAPAGTSFTGPFQVVLISPDGYPHAAAFHELAETVAFGLGALGFDVALGVNRLVWPGPPAVMFGANLLSADEAAQVPDDVVVYNLEQVEGANGWGVPHYLDLLRRCRVWDYSRRNLGALAARGARRAALVPVGYMPQMTRVRPAPRQDIDVLFYGSVNERRARVLADLRRRGLDVRAVFGVYGQERDALIARAKVVLNLHYYQTSIFELVRVSYLLANRKAVVAECNTGTEVDDDIAGGVRLAPYEELAGACAELVAGAEERAALGERGYSVMADRDEVSYLRAALSAPPGATG
jgi:hypothetical protein